ncbi:MAG: NADAR family protein [Solobacterium sp.]|nr:NADAR family protein [Solobacterium sp.]
MKVICFHNPDEENGIFSNWYPSTFVINGKVFSSMEQYMMYQKAACFHDAMISEKIMATDNVAEIKALGRQVANYNDHIWSGIRQVIVYEGLLAKFSQNKELKAQLLETGDALLAECAVHDRIWGIGLAMKDPNRLNIETWNGQNLLGYALMMVRDKLGN